jgi:hypothetical protein
MAPPAGLSRSSRVSKKMSPGARRRGRRRDRRRARMISSLAPSSSALPGARRHRRRQQLRHLPQLKGLASLHMSSTAAGHMRSRFCALVRCTPTLVGEQACRPMLELRHRPRPSATCRLPPCSRLLAYALQNVSPTSAPARLQIGSQSRKPAEPTSRLEPTSAPLTEKSFRSE